MKYYFITHSLNKKILGHNPQIKKINHNCSIYNNQNFIDKFQYNKIDIEPIISNPILYSNSKLTDFINVSGDIGFVNKILIGSKIKSILEKNKNSGIQFFRCPVFKDNIEYSDYWILNYYDVSYQFLDFKNSEIFETIYFDKKNKLEVDNNNDFIKKLKEIAQEGYPKGILIDKIVINNYNEHFFILQNTESGTQYIASEKLKKEIEEANCTGIEFQPIELSLAEWLYGGEREKIYGKA